MNKTLATIGITGALLLGGITLFGDTQPVALKLVKDSPIFKTVPVVVDPLVSDIKVSIERPTSQNNLNWDKDTTLKVSLVLSVDGVEQRVTGQVSGSIRKDEAGEELTEYTLESVPTIYLGDKAREYMRVNTRDQEGYWHDVPLSRVAEDSSNVTFYVEIELIKGSLAETSILSTEIQAGQAPKVDVHNSVAFDAATSAIEDNGDGIISLTHTSTGSNLAVFAGIDWQNAGTGVGSNSTTYGGTGMTEKWDAAMTAPGFTQYQNAAYTLAGQATGAQTVTNTLVATGPNHHILGVISMTGVDQVTPVGTPNTAQGTTNTATVTVASVGASDMVVDNLYKASTALTVGADQTLRYSQGASGTIGAGSTQLGSAGGVMSWSLGTTDTWYIGAIAFKPSGSAAVATPKYIFGGSGMGRFIFTGGKFIFN